jgi:excisionase family DNA binding protein
VNRKNGGSDSVFASVEDLAVELGLSRGAVYAGLRDGSIPHLRIGRRFVLPRAAIRVWLERAGSEPISAG